MHEEMHSAKISLPRFIGVLVANFVISITEVVGGILSNSLALISDALHNFSDVAAVGLSFFAEKIGNRPQDSKRTYGYKRAEILAAFINSTVLIVISILLIVETFKRFIKPEKINPQLMIFVGIIGLVANLLSVLLLRRGSSESLNVRSSFLHLLGDTLSSVVVVLGALSIKFFNLVWIDPAITVLICIYIIWESFKIVRKTVSILMQSAAEIDYEEMKKDIEALDMVKNIHHVHTWLGNENTIYFEAHIEVNDMKLSEVCNIATKIENLLKSKYGIEHTTLQFETQRCSKKDFFIKEEI
jgi:cobalt-zinc-cadmium efflux system protein